MASKVRVFDNAISSRSSFIDQRMIFLATRRSPYRIEQQIPEPRQLSDVIPGQYRANQIRLRRGVNFIQMTLRFRLQHEFLDALVESAVDDYVGTRAERRADALLVDRRLFSEDCASKSIRLSDMLGGFLSLKSGLGPYRSQSPELARTEHPIDRGPDLEDRDPLGWGMARFNLWRTAQNHGPLPAPFIFLKGVLDVSIFH
jgi:hypothetical protein